MALRLSLISLLFPGTDRGLPAPIFHQYQAAVRVS